MYIIAGLGNPTKEYEGTRHNVGFDVIDRLSERYNIDVTMEKHRALIGKGMIAGQKVILVKPQTYMNLSGEAVHEAVQFYKIPADHVLVLREGRAIFSGTLPELEASRDPYLLQFLRREGGDEESLADAPADPRVSAALDKWFRT